MSLTDAFKSVIPENAGKYNNATDLAMVRCHPSTGYTAQFPQSIPNANTTSATANATPPIVIIKERSYFPWSFTSFGHSTRPYTPMVELRHTSSEFQSAQTNEKEEKASEANVLTAFIFFSGVIVVGLAGIAYGLKELNKFTDNLFAQRKTVSTAIKTGLGTFFGLAGLKVGVSLGGFYGKALLGSAFLGSALSGFLLASAGISAGLFAGKYLSKFCLYIYSSGKSTKEATFSLRFSIEKKLNSQIITKSTYSGSRPDLMYCYLINKIEMAKTNILESPLNTDEKWLKELQSYSQSLKTGIFDNKLMTYFDTEWNVVKQAWLKRSQLSGLYYVDYLSLQIKHDLIALAIITGKEEDLKSCLESSSKSQISVGQGNQELEIQTETPDLTALNDGSPSAPLLDDLLPYSVLEPLQPCPGYYTGYQENPPTLACDIQNDSFIQESRNEFESGRIYPSLTG